MTPALRQSIALTLGALWSGAALLAAASVAPAAFAVLPTRTLAGSLVGRVLPVVFVGGLIVGVCVAWLEFPSSRVRATLGATVAVACAAAQFVVNPRIARIRAALGSSLDALAVDDPQRMAFGRLHAVSVGWLGVAMLAALVFMILSLLAMRQRA